MQHCTNIRHRIGLRSAVCVISLCARCAHRPGCRMLSTTERFRYSAPSSQGVHRPLLYGSCATRYAQLTSSSIAVSPSLHTRRTLTFSAAALGQHGADASSSEEPPKADARGKSHSSSAIASDEAIIQSCHWRSEHYAERLGLSAHPGASITEEQLKRYFFVLAKHFHPDSASDAGQNSTDAFRAVKEAFDGLDVAVKRVGGSVLLASIMYGDGSTASASFHFNDEAHRRAHVRLLGNGVIFFVLSTIVLVYVVARHNKARLGTAHWLNIVGIFIILQAFPRMLAAAILFAWQTSYLLDAMCAREQAKVHLVVSPVMASTSAAATSHVLTDTCAGTLFRLDGIDEEVRPHVVVQVEVRTKSSNVLLATPLQPQGSIAAAPITPGAETNSMDRRKEEPGVHAGDPIHLVDASTTLTMDPGVTAFILPSPPSNEDGTRPPTSYHVRGVDQKRHMVLIDHTFTLAE